MTSRKVLLTRVHNIFVLTFRAVGIILRHYGTIREHCCSLLLLLTLVSLPEMEKPTMFESWASLLRSRCCFPMSSLLTVRIPLARTEINTSTDFIFNRHIVALNPVRKLRVFPRCFPCHLAALVSSLSQLSTLY